MPRRVRVTGVFTDTGVSEVIKGDKVAIDFDFDITYTMAAD